MKHPLSKQLATRNMICDLVDHLRENREAIDYAINELINLKTELQNEKTVSNTVDKNPGQTRPVKVGK